MKSIFKHMFFPVVLIALFAMSFVFANTVQAAEFKAYDRGEFKDREADFKQAHKVLKSRIGKTDKSQCFECHTTISDLHNRGSHKDVDCTFCHDISPDHNMENASAENRPTTHMEWQACGQCHSSQMESHLNIGMHRPARFEKSNISGRAPNPAWDKLMAPYGFTKEHASTRSHAAMLIDQFVVDRAFGGQFQPKNGWNYIFETGPVWDVLEDAKEKNKDFKDLPQTARAVNPVCMNCKTMDHMLGWAYMGEPEEGTTWSRLSNPVEMAKNVNHGLNCFMCHDPHSAEPRIVRDALIESMTSDKPYHKDNLFQTDPNHVKFEVIEMGERGFTRKIAILHPGDNNRYQTLQCAQCHVEYNCGAGTDLKTGNKVGMNDPRTNHYPLKNVLSLYDHYFNQLDFADFKNKFSGALLWKGQHPEFETYYNSVHDKAGVSCVQCHMNIEVKGKKLDHTSHFVQSPRYILNQTCLTSDCHGTGADKHENWKGKDAEYVKVSTNWTEQDAKYSIDSIKIYTMGKMRKAEFWLTQLIDLIAEAERMNVSQAAIEKARVQHSKAHILWEYWTAENSDGFHNPALARESLTRSVNESMKGFDDLNKVVKAKAKTIK